MDFTKHGLIKIEGEGDEGEVLGLAVALGDKPLDEFGQAEVDTSPRDLDVEETVAAIHGLNRMAHVSSLHIDTVAGMINRYNVGENGVRAFYQHGSDAVNYLTEIALHGIQETQAVS